MRSLFGCIRDFVSLGSGCFAAIYVKVCLWPLVKGHEVSGAMTDVVLTRPHNLVLRVVHELVPVSQPTNSSGNHEKNGEHVSGEAHSFIDDSTVEINIGVEFSLHKVRIAERNFFEFDCDFNKFFLASDLEHIVRYFLDNLCSRVVALVNPMSKSVQ